MTDLHTALSLLQGSTLLAPVYGLDVEPGEQQRALLARILTHILGGQSPTLAPGAAGTGQDHDDPAAASDAPRRGPTGRRRDPHPQGPHPRRGDAW